MRPGTTSEIYPLGTVVRFKDGYPVRLYEIERVTMSLDREPYYHMVHWPRDHGRQMAGSPASKVERVKIQPNRRLVSFWLRGGVIIYRSERDKLPPVA